MTSKSSVSSMNYLSVILPESLTELRMLRTPIALRPYYIIGIGQIDDAVILGLSLYFLEKDLRKYKEWKDRNG